MSKHIDAFLEKAEAVLADLPDPVCVRLPELFRDYKRVVRQAALTFGPNLIYVSYQERSGDVSAAFQPVRSQVCDDVLEALAWAEGQGHAPAE